MTYAEAATVAENPTIYVKVRVAVVVAADVVRSESAGTTNHTARLAWAKLAVADPDAMARKMIWCVIAQNIAVALATVLAASDASVQTAVNAAVDMLT